MSGTRNGPSSVLRFGIALVAVVVILVGLRAGISPDHTSRNVEFMPEMVTSLATESQSVSDLLPGGLSHQALVAGVVPRGVTPFHYTADDAAAERAGRELTSPFAADDAAASARGARVFAIHCVPCHDAAGDGHGTAVLRGMLPPPSLHGANALQMPDGRMFHLLTLGRGNMPALGARIAPRDRWAAIRHVRSIQEAAAPTTEPGGEDDR